MPNGVGVVHVSSDAPIFPSTADFAIYIEFKKGEGNSSRVFQTADAIIRALQSLDRTLCAAIDSKIEPVLVLEEINASSLRIWLKQIIAASDDEAIKKLDWKQFVGSYLVRAKYIFIEWTNRTGEEPSLSDLSRRLAKSASDTDIKYFPDYAPPSVSPFVSPASRQCKLSCSAACGQTLCRLVLASCETQPLTQPPEHILVR
jgi:hypothetical protein